ncbi:MAG: DUF3592 domain-containing protein [Sandaracinaceae bacterium]
MDSLHGPWAALLAGASFAVLGLLMFLGFLWRRRAERRAEAWRPATGVVVSTSRDSAPNITVRYEDAEGHVHEVGSMGGSTGFPVLGEETGVRYDPANPADALIEVDVRMGRNVFLLLAAIFTGIGVLIGLGGLLG